MKKIAAFLILSMILTTTAAFAGDSFPTNLAGFTLGSDIKKYDSFCDMDTSTPMSDAPFLSEVLIKPDSLPGVRGGSLNYGNCKNVGKLVRVKIKFHDRSQDLFNELLDKYKDRFGKPDNYKGDAFKNVIAWEWDFNNGKGEQISLLLMWSRDKEIRPGVSIKMTNVTMFDEEYDCFKAKDYEFSKDKASRTKIKSLNEYVPQ